MGIDSCTPSQCAPIASSPTSAPAWALTSQLRDLRRHSEERSEERSEESLQAVRARATTVWRVAERTRHA
jgi:hypothetical protein